MTREDAKSQLIESVRVKAEGEALKQAKVVYDEAMNKANKDAKKIKHNPGQTSQCKNPCIWAAK